MAITPAQVEESLHAALTATEQQAVELAEKILDAELARVGPGVEIAYSDWLSRRAAEALVSRYVGAGWQVHWSIKQTVCYFTFERQHEFEARELFRLDKQGVNVGSVKAAG